MEVEVAMIIIGSFLGGGFYFLSARAGAGAWLAFMVGILVAELVIRLGPNLF